MRESETVRGMSIEASGAKRDAQEVGEAWGRRGAVRGGAVAGRCCPGGL